MKWWKGFILITQVVCQHLHRLSYIFFPPYRFIVGPLSYFDCLLPGSLHHQCFPHLQEDLFLHPSKYCFIHLCLRDPTVIGFLLKLFPPWWLHLGTKLSYLFLSFWLLRINFGSPLDRSLFYHCQKVFQKSPKSSHTDNQTALLASLTVLWTFFEGRNNQAYRQTWEIGSSSNMLRIIKEVLCIELLLESTFSFPLSFDIFHFCYWP